MTTLLPGVFPAGAVASFTLGLPAFWLSVLLTSVVCLLPVMTLRYLVNVWNPTLIDVVRKHEGSKCCECHPIDLKAKLRKRRDHDTEKGILTDDVAPSPQLERHGTKASSTGYAFSQESGYGDLIQSGRMSFVDTSSKRLSDMERVVGSESPIASGDIQPLSPSDH